MDLDGLPQLTARLDHAHAGLLDLTGDLAHQLEAEAPPMRAFASPRLNARTWGAGDVWTLPAGAWVADSHGRVDLPDPTDTLTTTAQRLLGN